MITGAKSRLIRQLVAVANAYLAARGQSRGATVAKAVFGRGGHLDDLENGRRDLSTGTYEKAMEFFSTNWPSGTTWPDGVVRPPNPPDSAQGAAAPAGPDSSGPAFCREAAE